PGFAIRQFKQYFRRRPCRCTAGSIFCVRRSWRCCTYTIWSYRRSAVKSYGDRYITSWSPPTRHTCSVVPSQEKTEHDHLLRNVALQRYVRDVLLLGRVERERRPLLG